MQKPIRSVEAQTHWMERVINLIKDPQAEERTMIGPMADAILAAGPKMEPARRAVHAHMKRRRRAVDTCSEALRKLSKYCSNALVIQERRFDHVDTPEEIKDVFEMHIARPKTLTDRGWVTIAKDLLFAEEQALAADMTPMVYPTAPELQTVLDEALAACAAVDRAAMRYREVSAELRAVNNEVAELVLDTASWFRFSLRRKAKPEQRDIMRRFGFTFSGDLSTEPPADPGGGEPTGSEAEEPAEPTTGTGASEPATAQGSEPTGNETNEPNTNQPSGNEGNQPTTGTGTTPAPTTQTPTGDGTKPTTTGGNNNGPVDSDASTGSGGSASTETPPIIQDRPTNNGRD